jgi:hypothetical protein
MAECFMYGDLAALDAPPAPVMTVLLIGFDGRRKVLTGNRDELWREYLHGDGGPGCNGVAPVGWEYWCPQPLLTPDAEASPSNPQIREFVAKKGK